MPPLTLEGQIVNKRNFFNEIEILTFNLLDNDIENTLIFQKPWNKREQLMSREMENDIILVIFYINFLGSFIFTQ